MQLGHVLARFKRAGCGIESDSAETGIVIPQGFRLACGIRGWYAAVCVTREQALACTVSRFNSDHVQGSSGLDSRPSYLDIFTLMHERLGCRDTVLAGHACVGLATSALPRIVVQTARQLQALEASEVGFRQLELAGLYIRRRLFVSLRNSLWSQKLSYA